MIAIELTREGVSKQMCDLEDDRRKNQKQREESNVSKLLSNKIELEQEREFFIQTQESKDHDRERPHGIPYQLLRSIRGRRQAARTKWFINTIEQQEEESSVWQIVVEAEPP